MDKEGEKAQGNMRNHLNDGSEGYIEGFIRPKITGLTLNNDVQGPYSRDPETGEDTSLGISQDFEARGYIDFFPGTTTAPDVHIFRGDALPQRMTGSHAPLEVYLPSGAYDTQNPDYNAGAPVDNISGEGGYDVVILPGKIEDYTFSLPRFSPLIPDAEDWKTRDSVYGKVEVVGHRTVDDGYGSEITEEVRLTGVERIIFSGEVSNANSWYGLQYEDLPEFFEAARNGTFRTLTAQELVAHIEAQSSPEDVALYKAAASRECADFEADIRKILYLEIESLAGQGTDFKNGDEARNGYQAIKESLDVRYRMAEQGGGDVSLSERERDVALRALEYAIANIDTDYNPQEGLRDHALFRHVGRSAAERIRDDHVERSEPLPQNPDLRNDSSHDPVANPQVFSR
ncbi:MAG: hypothetical protein KDI13_05680 [Alphaproteobacteria bacterium]|nr:hypothetical protein [Alphaproteobacteria bacterium]